MGIVWAPGLQGSKLSKSRAPATPLWGPQAGLGWIIVTAGQGQGTTYILGTGEFHRKSISTIRMSGTASIFSIQVFL